MNPLFEQMSQCADRLFAVVQEKDVVNVQFEIKRFPGGLTRSEFVCRVGDLMQPGYALTINESLEVAEREILNTINKAGWWERKKRLWMKEEARKMGFDLVPKKGAKR